MATNQSIKVDTTSSLIPSIRVLWVDQSIGEAGQHAFMKKRFGTLSPLIDQWLYFSSADEFLSYLAKNDNVTLICVMSGGMSRSLVPENSHHRSLHSIYVFCADVGRAREAMADQTKVKGVFNIEDELYEQMSDDLAKLLLQNGIDLAQLDERRLARVYYTEAQRLVRSQTTRLSEKEKRTRSEEIDVRLDQLLA